MNKGWLYSLQHIFKKFDIIDESTVIYISIKECSFNIVLTNEVENVINDEDGTFVDRKLVDKEIVNSGK